MSLLNDSNEKKGLENEALDIENTFTTLRIEEGVQELLSHGNLEREFFQACKGKSAIEIRDLLPAIQPGSVNSRDKNGVSGMNWACFCNNLTIVKALIECEELDINIPDNDGNTPLMTAAQAGHYEIVRYIINTMHKHVHIDAENHCGFTALMKAALNGKSNCARILIAAGADATKKDWGKGLRADEWARTCGMHETAIIIKNMAKCTLTLEQNQELMWEKRKRHPVVEFITAAGNYIRRKVGWDGEQWIIEAGSLYHLASHSATLNSGILTMVLTPDRPARSQHYNINHVDSSMSCISTSSQGEDTILIETTYSSEHSGSPKQTITQHCYETPSRQVSRQKSKAKDPSWTVPDVQLVTASPVKKEKKQARLRQDRNMLVVPPRSKRRKNPD